MVHTRRNLWTLPAGDPTLAWFGRAIAAMQAKPRRDPGSWGWQAAIHGWSDAAAQPGEALPSAAERRRYWNQCQHGSWYFLPWHRGYLAAFEQIVRAQVVRLGGPADWALPYWDMARPAWQRIRPEFCTPRLSDGTRNPLYVAQRRPGFETGDVGIVPSGVDPARFLLEPEFGGATAGGAPGFGGPQTDFFHGPGTLGALEGAIHNYVHSRVAGFMGGFNTAGLDPLFWLHHCNVDRLWEVWRARNPRHRDPTSARWRNGPTAQRFMVRDAQGQPWTFTANEMRDTRQPRLDYVYEDIRDPLAGAVLPPHLQPFAAPITAAAPGARAVSGPRRKTMRVLGAVSPGVTIGGARSTARVPVSTPPPPRGGLRAFAADEPRPARVLLNLENITGIDGSQTYKVFVNLPDDGDPATDERNLAGIMSLFGIDSASDPDGEHAGNGLTYVFDITALAGAHAGEIDGAAVKVDFVSLDDDTPEESAQVGRISIVRETA